MQFLTKISLKNIIAVIILSVFVLGGGYLSATQIKLQTFPDITFPALFVQVQYFGESAEDIEKNVVTVIEQSLLGLKNSESITSTSAENFATVFISYPFGSDLDELVNKTEDAIAKLDLPEQAKVSVLRLSFDSVPIYQAAISTQDNGDIQTTLENELLPQLQKIDGVGTIKLIGTTSQEIRVEVDQTKASALGITLQSILSTMKSQDYVLSLGSVQQASGSIPVSLSSSMDSLAQLEDMELPAGFGGGFGGASFPGAPSASGTSTAADTNTPATPVVTKLSDIAEVVMINKQTEISRYNGQPSLILEVTKSQEANTAELANAVKSEIEEIQKTTELNLNVIFDQGAEVEKSVSTLVKEGLYGALFTSLVILLFLRNFRATLIAIFSLPLSIFITITVIDQFGYTLNIMTLGGLAVSIGRIVDDSIVVIENIFRWRTDKGKDVTGKALIYKATSEVLGAISSSTFATVVVFLPLAFVSGIIGEFFRPFAVTVVVAIISSLLVAVAVIPVLGHLFLNKVKHQEKESRFILWFERVLIGALKRKAIVIITAVVLLFGSFGFIPLLGLSFLPSNAEPTLEVKLKLPANTKLDETDVVVKQIETYLESVPEVTDRQVAIGSQGNDPSSFGIPKTNEALITIKLNVDTEVDPVLERLTEELNVFVKEIDPDAQINVQQQQGGGPPSGNNVTVNLFGNDPKQLTLAASQIESYMKLNDNLKNISNNLKEVQPKWIMTINETGKAANVNAFQIVETVNPYLRALDAGEFKLDEVDWKVTVSYAELVTTQAQLEAINIMTAQGMKKIGDIAAISQAEAPVSINHQDGRSAAQVSAIIKGSDVTQVSNKVKLDLAALTLPQGVEYSSGGGSDDIIDGFIDLGIAVLVAIGLVFLVLSITFGGLLTPMIILSSLIFIPIGSLSGLLIGGQTLSISAMIGILMLIGIVVTNAVVLLDRVEKNRKSGMEIQDSLIEASKTRMRPILMTAAATICALLPLAFSTSTSGLISQGLAITVIGGLTTSTLLTLIFVPVLYSIFGKYRKITVGQDEL